MKTISYFEAKAKVLCAYPGYIILGSNYLPDGYLFATQPWTVPQGELYLGGYCKVTHAGELFEYSPVMDSEEFKEALNHPIEIFKPGQT